MAAARRRRTGRGTRPARRRSPSERVGGRCRPGGSARRRARARSARRRAAVRSWRLRAADPRLWAVERAEAVAERFGVRVMRGRSSGRWRGGRPPRGARKLTPIGLVGGQCAIRSRLRVGYERVLAGRPGRLGLGHAHSCHNAVSTGSKVTKFSPSPSPSPARQADARIHSASPSGGVGPTGTSDVGRNCSGLPAVGTASQSQISSNPERKSCSSMRSTMVETTTTTSSSTVS